MLGRANPLIFHTMKNVIDVTAAIDHYNQNRRDDQKKLTREDLAVLLKTDYQSLVNYQNGRVPKIVPTIMQISSFTGLPMDELLKTVSDE